MYILKKCLTKSKSAEKKIKAENYIMETLFLKKSPSFTNKLGRAKHNFSVTYDDIKSPDDIRCFDGTCWNRCDPLFLFTFEGCVIEETTFSNFKIQQ